MSKKSSKSILNADFTINDSANASKPINRVKKSIPEPIVSESSWEDIQDGDFDIVEETNPDGTKKFVCKKKRNLSKTEEDNMEDRPGAVYPEIVWYLISYYIKPEDIGRFAGICKTTYAMTIREAFWRNLYKRYCLNSPNLPEKLGIEYNYKLYGLRPRVIRALYHTYDVFIHKVANLSIHDSRPHLLVKRRCTNVWYSKGCSCWSVFFKLKKCPQQRAYTELNLIEELGRIDANPDADTQVLQVFCQTFSEVPPVMGMTLSSVTIALSRGFRHHRLQLGFTSNHQYISKDVLPEMSVVIDTVVNMFVMDWWHPRYPHYEISVPASMTDEEASPVLKKDFFRMRDVDF